MGKKGKRGKYDTFCIDNVLTEVKKKKKLLKSSDKKKDSKKSNKK